MPTSRAPHTPLLTAPRLISPQPHEPNPDSEMDSDSRNGAAMMNRVLTAKTNARTADKQTRLQTRYDEQRQQISRDVEKIVAAHEATVSRSRSAQLTRLMELVDQKAQIERGLVGATADLNRAFACAAAQLEVILVGRSEDLRRGLDAVGRAEESEHVGGGDPEM